MKCRNVLTACALFSLVMVGRTPAASAQRTQTESQGECFSCQSGGPLNCQGGVCVEEYVCTITWGEGETYGCDDSSNFCIQYGGLCSTEFLDEFAFQALPDGRVWYSTIGYGNGTGEIRDCRARLVATSRLFGDPSRVQPGLPQPATAKPQTITL